MEVYEKNAKCQKESVKEDKSNTIAKQDSKSASNEVSEEKLQGESVKEHKSKLPKVDKQTSKVTNCHCVKNSDRKCFSLMEEGERKRIYDQYWHNATDNSRFNFVNEMIDMVKSPTGQYDSKFHLNTEKGREEVCRACFQVILIEDDHIIKSVLEEKLRELKSKYLFIFQYTTEGCKLYNTQGVFPAWKSWKTGHCQGFFYTWKTWKC